MLDGRVLAILDRLAEEDARERAQGLPGRLRSRAIPPATGRLLFALVAPQNGCEVLEIGGSRGYSTLWLAAGARILGGHVTSLERDPVKCEAWRANVAAAGLEEWATLLEGEAAETLATLDEEFDVVFLDADKDEYERLFELALPRLEPGGLVVADNILSHPDPLAEYSRRRQADPRLSSVTVPLDRGLEVTVVLSGTVR